SPAKFNEMLERRGSVAAQLDHHPPNWTGQDEALFRYGDAGKAEANYRWKMDPDGSLTYERLDKTQPLHRFNPLTEEFEVASEAGLHKAERGAEQTFERATLPEPQKEAMDEAHEAGNGPALKAEEAAKLKKLYAQINEQSRQLGEEAAEGVMQGRG